MSNLFYRNFQTTIVLIVVLFSAFGCGTKSAIVEVPVETRAAAICSMHLPKEPTLEAPPTEILMSLAKMQLFAKAFPTVVADLRKGNYSAAAALMKKRYGYVDGRSDTIFSPADQYLFKGQFQRYFASMYQGEFCFGSGYLNPRTAEGPAQYLFAQALRAGVNARYAEAHEFAIRSYASESDFGEGLMLAGAIDIAMREPSRARSDWLRALTVHGITYPEQVGPASFGLNTATYLLHYRP